MGAPQDTLNAVHYRLVDLSSSNPLLDDPDTLQAAVNAALAKYSQDRPREVVEDEPGTGSPFFILVGTGAVLASWSDGFSSILAIEYPAGAVGTDYVPTYLQQQDDWQADYRDASKTYLRLKTVAPSASETIRVTYTAPHTHTTLADTVPTADREAVYDLAASFACMQLATKAAGSSDSVIAADSTNYRDSQLRYKQQAEMWLKSYQDRMGIQDDGKGGGVVAASANADWDASYSFGRGRVPFLTHNPRFR